MAELTCTHIKIPISEPPEGKAHCMTSTDFRTFYTSNEYADELGIDFDDVDFDSLQYDPTRDVVQSKVDYSHCESILKCSLASNSKGFKPFTFYNVLFKCGTMISVQQCDFGDDEYCFESFLEDYAIPMRRFKESKDAKDCLIRNEVYWRDYYNTAAEEDRQIARIAMSKLLTGYPYPGHASSDSNCTSLWKCGQKKQDQDVYFATCEVMCGPAMCVMVELRTGEGWDWKLKEYVAAATAKEMYRNDYLEPRIVRIFPATFGEQVQKVFI